MSIFKPQLLPNNEAGEILDWDALITVPSDWMTSNKLDGARVEIFPDGTIKGRSLKPLNNVHIQRMAKRVAEEYKWISDNLIIEAEFYGTGMTFSEIMHFFKSEDVESESTKSKYQKLWAKTGGDQEKGWPFPGRSAEWLTTWPSELLFCVFDVVNTDLPQESKLVRYATYIVDKFNYTPHIGVISQRRYNTLEDIIAEYNVAKTWGHEGLVLIHKDTPYKFGRHTLNSNVAFKMKDDSIEFDGQILSVEEATVAREGSEKTVNELGRSVTSKLQEDRVPAGMAKGFLVQMEDGNTLTVSLKNFNHEERRELFEDPSEYIGKWIKFTGMAPVKQGGVPRHAHFTKGNIRDAK